MRVALKQVEIGQQPQDIVVLVGWCSLFWFTGGDRAAIIPRLFFPLYFEVGSYVANC